MRLGTLGVMGLSWACWASAAAAQAPCADETGAREAFRRGMELGGERRLTAARGAYERSLARCPRIPTAYNLAVLLLQLGEALAAEARARSLLAEDLGPLDATQRAAVADVLDRAEREAGTLRIRVAPERLGGSAAVSVDGRTPVALPPSGRVDVRVDPGIHRVVLRSADGRLAETERHARPGQLVWVPLDLPLAVEPPAAAGGHRLWWLWAALGVAAVGSVVAAGVLIARSREGPVADPVWGRAGLPLLRF